MVQRLKRTWHCLHVVVPQSRAEQVAAHCFELGTCGLEVDEQGEATRLTAYFDGERDGERVRAELTRYLRQDGLVASEVSAGDLEEQDWESEWRRFFGPVWATPRIVVHPSWIPVEVRDDQIALIIDPNMAFGTGGHESTQLCLQALDGVLRHEAHCLDLGTGSGILAMAAARLGAGHIVALDTDPDAIANARQNLARNGITPAQVELRHGSLEDLPGQRFDLILANIQSSVLAPILGPIRDALLAEGHAVLSGLIAREEQAFCGLVEAAGLTVRKVHVRNNWICVVAQG